MARELCQGAFNPRNVPKDFAMMAGMIERSVVLNARKYIQDKPFGRGLR